MKSFLLARQSWLIAFGMVALVTIWIFTGSATSDEHARTASATNPERRLLSSVRVRRLEPRRISREVVFSGRTEPARTVTLRAEINARVNRLGARRGARVARGDLVVRLDLRDRESQLAEARAMVAQRSLEYDAAARLQRDSLQSEAQLAAANARLESARARVERIRIEIANATIRAPFGGILERRPVEVGTYVGVGDEIARIIEDDPMLVTGSVTQQDRGRLVLGDRGLARLVTGQLAEGGVRYIAAMSDPATRTFRVELEVPNPGGALVAGVAGEISIPVQLLNAYHLSPAVLSLDAADRVGIKVVDDDDLVRFVPVEVVRSTADGVWLTGPEKGARAIVVGQGFARPGQRVLAVDEDEIAAEPDDREQ